MTVNYIIISCIKHLFHVVTVFGSRDVIGDIIVPKSLALLCQTISDTGELLTGRRAATAPLCLVFSIVLISLPHIVIRTFFRFVECHSLVILCSIYTH